MALAALFWASTILTTASSPASASATDPGNKNDKKKPLSPEERLRLQKRVDEVKGLLEEVHQGKRDDSEEYVLLRHLLTNYALLQMEKADPDVLSAKQEWDELIRKHPEFKSNPPLEIKEQRELRKRQQDEDAQIQAKAKSFSPRDARLMGGLRGYGNKAVAPFQFRLEFYRLQDDIELGATEQSDEHILTRKGQSVPLSNLTPHRTISFAYPVVMTPSWPPALKHPFWACTDLLHGYSANSEEERKILRQLGHDGWMPWVDIHADHKDFCGVISLDGEVLYSIPIKQEVPNQLLRVLEVTNDGARAVLILGERTSYGPDDGVMVGNPRQVLLWESPNVLRRFNIDAAPTEAVAALRRWGWVK